MVSHSMYMPVLVALALLPRPPIDERPVAIPKGHVAYGMRVDANSVAQVLPGSRVDVIVTTKKSPKVSEVRIVCEKALVLALDEEARGNQQVITIAVTPKTAAELERHRKSGGFSIALRPID
jgi:Flp pilus assembly protein CpaB